MHGCHQALLDAIVLVDDLCERGQAIRCARSIGNNSVRGLVLGVVHTNDVDGNCILWWRRDDDLLGTTFQVELCLLLSCEDTCGLADVTGSACAPRNGCRVLLVEDGHIFAIHDEKIFSAFLFCRDCSRESVVHTIVFKLVHHVLQIHEWLIDGLDLDRWVCRCCTKNETTNAAKAIDTHASHVLEVQGQTPQGVSGEKLVKSVGPGAKLA
mmetsp:Transcript_63592/g.110920  ORF Transcript_63592/g.110920 Transcript_63592/m.110920 type:complete len:211 (+) Transcript_63592:306-938(+)